MQTLLNPATGKYLLNPAPEHLHQEVIRWISDLEFCKIELTFLGKLLDKAFLRITSSQQHDKLNVIDNKLNFFRKKSLGDLNAKLIQHENELSSLDLDVFHVKRKDVEEEHSNLHYQLESVLAETRQLKKEIFDLVENQIRIAKKVTQEFEEGNISL